MAQTKKNNCEVLYTVQSNSDHSIVDRRAYFPNFDEAYGFVRKLSTLTIDGVTVLGKPVIKV
jgi:hypothetical protein